MQGLEDKGGEEKEKDSAEELFSYGPLLNLLYYILCMSVESRFYELRYSEGEMSVAFLKYFPMKLWLGKFSF